MSWLGAAGLLIGMILAFMGLGVPVAFAFLAADIIGAMVFMGGVVGIEQLISNAFSSITTFALAPVPLFLIMGELFFHTGLAKRMFDAIDALLGGLRARLSYLTVVGGTAFATLSGSSMASTALLGSLMIPEMSARGYKKTLSIGPILGTGGLAMLIPPSALAVLLGTLARIDIGLLLIAGVVPGLLLAGLYVLLITAQSTLDPKAAPAYDVVTVPWGQRIRLLVKDVLPLSLVVFLVIGLILLGWATPTEAAAFGVLGVVILGVVYRCLSWEVIMRSLEGATRVTAMALLIILGSTTFSQLLAYSGASSGLISWAAGLGASPIAMLLMMFAVLLLLGMFMDQLSMMLLTVPIFFPLAESFGFDLIWFAVIVLMALEISFTTPPFGLLLFVMKGVAPPDTRMTEIYVAALPYIGCSMLVVGLLIAEPEIALWLTRFVE
ncbi:MAG: TRAP transporter large permease subunit [Gammaproteobacteria bacterium]|nr:TRAP transporter large permease subunit [Gammaproteobacteria bacterium]